MPKYETAYFLNDDNVWEPVSYRELRDENMRARLRDKDLRERKSGEILLGIRNHPDTPHFFRKRLIRKNIEKGMNESEKHNNVVGFLEKYLDQKFSKHDFGYYERPWAKDKGFGSIVKAKSFKWGKEVGFGLAYGKYVIFDILGRSSENISLLDSSPYVAIEVIDTHFHSKDAFIALLELSKNLPFIILYYYVNKFPLFNQHKDPLRSNGYSKIRIHSYIADGSFWIRDSRIEEGDDVMVSPDLPSEYYNLIKERLLTEGFIRKET
ncbi:MULTISPECIES: hypothetical protein [Aeromonas]|uniref:hypothetical protein n=1 Tax=Aeromonas TaxID=642 RepID=UPI0012F1C4F4|nr:hypothetical protein [Aeromonas salmonicida]VXA77289.1 conserved hypothetical protein [Aeromonas salmonicida]